MFIKICWTYAQIAKIKEGVNHIVLFLPDLKTTCSEGISLMNPIFSVLRKSHFEDGMDQLTQLT